MNYVYTFCLRHQITYSRLNFNIAKRREDTVFFETDCVHNVHKACGGTHGVCRKHFCTDNLAYFSYASQ